MKAALIILVLVVAACGPSSDPYPAIQTCEVRVTLKLASPDVVNAWVRETGSGAPVQAVSGTKTDAGVIYLSWPPSSELGMSRDHLIYAAGYELFNLCRIHMDPKGR